MKIAITGANGLIGGALGGSLEKDGHEVLRLRRGSEASGAHWDPGSGWIRPGVLAGTDAVVHLAGASIGSGRWTTARKRELRESRIASTRLLVEHLRTLDHPPQAFIAASAIGYYGDRGSEELTEASGPGTGFLADLVRDWEASIQEAAAPGTRVAIPRLAVVLSRAGGAFPRMLLPFRFGAGGRLGNGRQWFSWITLDDAVAVFRYLLETPGAAGIYNAAAPGAVTNAEFTRALGKALRRPAILPAPAFALRLALGEAANELLLAGQRVVPARLQAEGFAFRHPEIAGALAAVL